METYTVKKELKLFNTHWKIGDTITDEDIEKLFSENTKEYLILDKWIEEETFKLGEKVCISKRTGEIGLLLGIRKEVTTKEFTLYLVGFESIGCNW